MVAQLPVTIGETAEALHEVVRLVREAGEEMGLPLADLTDLEVLAIMEWADHNTPPGLDRSMVMIGILVTMKGGVS